MRFLLLLVFVLLQIKVGDPEGITGIATKNRLKDEAAKAYIEGDFEKAASIYRTLLDSMNVEDEPVKLNYAHAFYHFSKNDTTKGDLHYRELAANAENKQIKSIAFQQLGIIATKDKNLKDAVLHFKQALLAHPGNEQARFNYELAKKQLQEQQQQEKEEQEKQQQNQEQQQQQNQQQEQIKPSEWAKELKKKADKLVNKQQYQNAFQLMQDGLQQDKTVRAYNDFIKRLQDVVEIESL